MKVTIYNENIHEKKIKRLLEIYPNGLHGVLGDIAREDEHEVRYATLDMPECGLTDEILNDTDVLIWWGHAGHDLVPDYIANKVRDCVLKGMGLIVLHSGHYSKPFVKLMGTSCSLRWRDDTYERIFNVMPNHPIAKGIPANFELGRDECYGERFDIPTPDELIFIGWYDIGEVFRSGCTWRRGYGKVFYFQPGHETNTSFHNKYVRQIIKNAINWAKSDVKIDALLSPHIEKTLEEIRKEND